MQATDDLAGTICCLLKEMALSLYIHQRNMPVFRARIDTKNSALSCFLLATHEQQLVGESLYYALVAEVRILYSELKKLHSDDLLSGDTLLHHFGTAGTSDGNEPFTALAFAAQLEYIWKELMSTRLTTALDQVIRSKQAIEEVDDRLPSGRGIGASTGSINTTGLLEVNAMTANEVLDVIWCKHAVDIERKRTLIEFDRPTVHRANPFHPNTSCTCVDTCDCCYDCRIRGTECSCARVRKQMQELIDQSMKLTNDVPSVAFPGHTFALMYTKAAQMDVSTQATPEPNPITPANGTRRDTATREAPGPQQHRQHALPENSTVTDTVQPKTPSRATKEKYPLGFYGDISDHRYPPVRSTSACLPPSFAAPVPARKPVPTPGHTPRPDIDRTVSVEAYTELTTEAYVATQPHRDDTYSPSSPPTPSDLISPRPALRQRYVSAGGNTPLRDRPEIPGPATLHASSGGTMSKEEMERILSDPGFIEQNFGEAGLKKAMGEAECPRTESGTSRGSKRFSKLKRIFSRKSDDGEAD